MQLPRERIQEIRRRIDAAAGRAGRDPREITLMAVTKTYNRDTVLAAYGEGIRVFGENRVHEAREKYVDMPEDVELHLIGHLQTNKAKIAAEIFPWIESLDSFHTAEALEKRLAPLGKTVSVLLEVNTAGEDAKSGYRTFDDLCGELEGIFSLPHLRLRGLMTVGPLTEDARQVREAFRLLKTYLERLRSLLPGRPLDTLSMGMSSDFEIAIEEGASLIRIGSALFGRRSP